MKKLPFLLFLLLIILNSCKGEYNSLTEIDGKRIAVDTSLAGEKEITEFIRPYKEHLNATLDSTLAYNPEFLSKRNGDLNTAIGNLMADGLMEQTNPLFEKRTGKKIDLVLLNHGGIRAEIPIGNVTTRTAYQIMPFENEVVIAEITGKKIKEMLNYLGEAKSAHPVSGIKIVADKDYNIVKATINGEEIRDDKTYFVATSDYLVSGGDNMRFFEDPVNLYETDYKIRNAMIDYFKKVDTIKSAIDNRYIRE